MARLVVMGLSVGSVLEGVCDDTRIFVSYETHSTYQVGSE